MKSLFSRVRRRLFGLPEGRQQKLPKVESVIVGLGNPGEKYENTRHNCGFLAIDLLVSKLTGQMSVTTTHSLVIVGKLPNGSVVALAKPQTFMNRSGVAVKELGELFEIETKSILVLVDDFNIPLGRLRFRGKGSDGGHNGLKSIIEAAGNGFPRLRMGIGPLPAGISVIDFVLGKFDKTEEKHKTEVIAASVEAVEFFCERGIEQSMSRFNSAKRR